MEEENNYVGVKTKEFHPDTKIQLKIFFLISFVLNFIMGIGIYYGNKKGIDVNMFPVFQMMTPALGAIIALMITRKDDPKLAKVSFIIYIVTSGVIGIASILSLFIKDFPVTMVSNLLLVIGNIFFIIGMIADKYKKRVLFNLNVGNKKRIISMVSLFILLYFLRIATTAWISGEIDEYFSYFTIEKIVYAIILIPNFFLSFLAFFGEEYGWRYFLQPILQKKFGMTKGLIILGFVWGVWHLPLNLFYYSAEGTGLMSLVNQLFICITYSIMFGFAYSYSESIWTVVAIHYFNNNLVLFFTEGFDNTVIQGQEYTWPSVWINALSGIIFFGIFLFSKYNRKKEFRIPTANERLNINKDII